MIELQTHAKGTVLPVRVRAGARRNDLAGEQDGALKVMVTQAPEKGKANKAVLELLSRRLGVRKSQLRLLAGETSPQKKILVEDVTPDQLRARIDAAANA